SAAELRLQDLASEGEADLFVVFVDDFTDPPNAQQWADAVAMDNGLGPQQYLLAIATEGRNYYISADEEGPISSSRVTEIEQNIQPYLSDEDWAGAIDRAASEFAAGGGAGGSGLGTILIVLLVAAVIAFIVWL